MQVFHRAVPFTGEDIRQHAVSLELATGLLRELPVEELPLYRSWCVVQAKAKRLSPVASSVRSAALK